MNSHESTTGKRTFFKSSKKASSSSSNSTSSSSKRGSTKLATGNEEPEKNIFIDIEPTSQTHLLVKDKDPATVPEQGSSLQISTGSELAQTEKPDKITVDINRISHNSTVEAHNDDGSISSTTTESDDFSSMPSTSTRLTTPNGSEVFLIGTAHFSLKSVKDVQRAMRIVKPSAVILELCQERAFMLSLDEESLIERNKSLSFEKIREVISAKGFAQGLIYVMFIKMSAKLTEKLGLAPGVEFRAASNEAQKIPGCSVVLGDRSVRVTVARAVASVSTWQKIKIIWQVLANDVSVTQEEIEKFKEKDILEQLLEQLGGEFPGFKRTILDERNVFLAHSIYHWAQQNSETSDGPRKFVAIVGIGHVAGIVENWGKTTDEEVNKLKQMPETIESSRTRRIICKTIKYSSIALLLYVGYRITFPSSIQTAIQEKFSQMRMKLMQ